MALGELFSMSGKGEAVVLNLNGKGVATLVRGCGSLPNSSARLSEWKFSISWINLSSSKRKLLKGFFVLRVVVEGSSFSGGNATPTPVSEGTKSGGGSLGSLK